MRVPRSMGRSSFAVGAVVVMWKETSPDAFVAGGTVQTDRDALSVQVKVMVPLKPVSNATVTVASTADPCAT